MLVWDAMQFSRRHCAKCMSANAYFESDVRACTHVAWIYMSCMKFVHELHSILMAYMACACSINPFYEFIRMWMTMLMLGLEECRR